MFKWIILGLIAGALARFFTPGQGPSGCVVTILLGIAGALLAGYIGRVAGWYHENDSAGLVSATLGAIAILALYRFALRRS
ncbi:GlsB/YeaQ/YmgE family stress response membrane protein [Sphingobium subterraneum]|uniref:Putative membrane protein YeaQ/YmgE (Transglycosylase-associated protein family) n=1 Tax=Sphingobium subterraneum TaxID=627688 RepID=A0A841J2D4_9SPHN|nr:GlsB/YeaQ/YmgE family stress response membrane protein [Sphingobium subterraneum]MBB6124512.1 putative membrane protein YeaQ/YmgE (transglycosylase-associated protein family) [Sphingobium subterraneum]